MPPGCVTQTAISPARGGTLPFDRAAPRGAARGGVGPYSLPCARIPSVRRLGAVSAELNSLRTRRRNPRAGDLLAICMMGTGSCRTRVVPLRIAGPIARRFPGDLRAERRALAYYESLKMTSREDSSYKDFDSAKACVSPGLQNTTPGIPQTHLATTVQPAILAAPFRR
jgi:hypothetical protein